MNVAENYWNETFSMILCLCGTLPSLTAPDNTCMHVTRAHQHLQMPVTPAHQHL